MALSGFLATDIVGVASTKWNHEEFVNYAFDSIKSVVKAPDDKVLAFLDKHLDLVVGKYQEQTLYDDLAKRLEGKHNIVIYLAIPPSAFEQVTRGLHAAGLMGRVRLVVEKPFGRDLKSAIHLQDSLEAVLPEERIFRIDHYLGKESVEDILIFRFANSIWEPALFPDFVGSWGPERANELVGGEWIDL